MSDELDLDAMAARAQAATGLKWLTADDTKRLDALAADVTALVAEVRRLRARLQDAQAEAAAYHDSVPEDVWDIITGGGE